LVLPRHAAGLNGPRHTLNYFPPSDFIAGGASAA
jgi:hypothetical protein